MMFSPDDFQLPLEKELRLRVITKEIEECTNVEALQSNLKICSASLMRYQHLLGKAIEANLINDLTEIIDTMKEEVSKEDDAN